jgi:RNA polymerase sigma-70 factor (ECF subfamily)
MSMLDMTVAAVCASEAEGSRLAVLFDTHHVRLFRLARRLSTSNDEAEDLVQETFLRAATARVPSGAPSEEAWLVRVLVNLSRDRWRRAAVRTRTGPTAERVPVDAVEDKYVARLAVQAALLRLDPRRRAVIVLHEIEGVTAPAISRLLGISPVTVRWHLSRGRQELARVLLSKTGNDV